MKERARMPVMARNAVWNLVGLSAPISVALLAIPALIRILGEDRFGFLAIAWATVGYFTLFDFGIGRAVTQLMVQNLARRRFEELPALFWTALALTIAFGCVGGAALAAISPLLITKLLKVPADLQVEALWSFYLLAATLPLVVVAAALRGTLAAYQRFDLINMVQSVAGVLNFGAPLIVAMIRRNLVPVILVVSLSRVVSTLVIFYLCAYVAPHLRSNIVVSKKAARPLVTFGGWVTVSNLVSPILVYFDRFVIGSMVSMAAVTLYSTPFEVLSRVGIIPNAISWAAFPAFAEQHAVKPAHGANLADLAVRTVTAIIAPIVIVVMTFGHDLLSLWLGKTLAAKTTGVLEILSFGVLINCSAFVPFVLIQACDRPDLLAKLHIAELPAYLAILPVLVHFYGVNGAALAWTLRVTVDTGIIFVLTVRLLPEVRSTFRNVAVTLAAAAAAAAFGGLVLCGLESKVQFIILALSVWALFVWFVLLLRDERVFLRDLVLGA